jgi:hypothetical protein
MHICIPARSFSSVRAPTDVSICIYICIHSRMYTCTSVYSLLPELLLMLQYVCTYVYIHVCTHAHLYTLFCQSSYQCFNMYIHMYTFTYVHMHICIPARSFSSVRAPTDASICIYICIHSRMDICTSVYLRVHSLQPWLLPMLQYVYNTGQKDRNEFDQPTSFTEQRCACKLIGLHLYIHICTSVYLLAHSLQLYASICI